MSRKTRSLEAVSGAMGARVGADQMIAIRKSNTRPRASKAAQSELKRSNFELAGEPTALPALANGRHERFAQEIANGKSANEAYELAGYSSNRGNASVLKRKQCISKRVAEILAERRTAQAKATEIAIATTGITKAWVLERLRQNVERAMTVDPVLDAGGKPTGEFRYQGAVANRALELLGRQIGMFVERSEQGKPGDFSDLPDEELERRIRDELVKAGVPDDIASSFARARSAD